MRSNSCLLKDSSQGWKSSASSISLTRRSNASCLSWRNLSLSTLLSSLISRWSWRTLRSSMRSRSSSSSLKNLNRLHHMRWMRRIRQRRGSTTSIDYQLKLSASSTPSVNGLRTTISRICSLRRVSSSQLERRRRRMSSRLSKLRTSLLCLMKLVCYRTSITRSRKSSTSSCV